MYTTVIWATDGSHNANVALTAALDMARATEAHVLAVHVDQRLTGRAAPWPALPDEEDRRERIRRYVEQLKSSGLDIQLVIRRTHRAPADTIASIADEVGADLIICGTHGRSAVGGAVLGSVAHGLLHVATCPVLVVPERARVRQAEPLEAVRT
jgi:nucleotide-binding universal stress UspA family protein